MLAAVLCAACARGGGGAPWLTQPTPAQHGTRWFPIGGGTTHEVATCDDCHGAFDTFARYDCLHCHTGDHADEAALTQRHASVASFRYASDACYGCHRDGVGVNHAALFPISSGAHAGVACASCHVSAADRSVLGCAGCHDHEASPMASAHAAVGGYAFDPALCVRCHGDGQVDRMAAHVAFPIVAPARHAGTLADCLRCHPSRRTDKPFAEDFSIAECLGCHDRADTDPRHTGVAGYAWSTADCLRCHPRGTGGSQ